MRFNDGPDLVWLSAQYIEVDGSAKPGSYDYPDHGTNDAATIRIKSQTGDDALLITGRPERLLTVAQEILRAAELVVMETMRDPELRRLYGIPSQVGTPTERSH